jgi:hypothetical protein
LKEKEAHGMGLLEAASYIIQGIGTSPSGLKEAAYQFAVSDGEKNAYEDLWEAIAMEEAAEDLEVQAARSNSGEEGGRLESLKDGPLGGQDWIGRAQRASPGKVETSGYG